MTVQDDLRRLSQMDAIYLGQSLNGMGAQFIVWHKGRLQQANDGSWIFRSISADGTIVGIQLGGDVSAWQSNELPATGITVTFQITQTFFTPGRTVIAIAQISLAQQVPSELTN